MLIHGRLVVTHNGLMLDEVRSLLQKCLRRQELDLAYRATKELIGHEKDQLPWKSLVTFMFEDHCLTDATTLETFYNCYTHKRKYRAVEVLGKCFTCRHAACLQVVALDGEYKVDVALWDVNVPLDPNLAGLVAKSSSGMDCDVLLTLIAKYWKEQNTKGLTTLFSLVNMAAKVENRTLTGKGIAYLLVGGIKKPSLYHLVLSVIHRASTEDYMKKYTKLAYKFAAIEDTPQGLILFCTLSQCIFRDKVSKHTLPDMSQVGSSVSWGAVPKLDHMPLWAVDKHTFRGRFGKESLHIFKKKFRNSPMTNEQLNEFHGPRPKVDLRTFFDVGCICNNDILDENPIWEKAKAMYFKHKPSQQKAAKMTKARYQGLKESKSIIFRKVKKETSREIRVEKNTLKRTSTASSTDEPGCSGEPSKKIAKLDMPIEPSKQKAKLAIPIQPSKKKIKLDIPIEQDDGLFDVNVNSGYRTENKATTPVAIVKQVGIGSIPGEKLNQTVPKGPLLQLPTGSAKVYTRLDNSTKKVWKGPYKSTYKQNLCIFFHRAMKEVFQDKHTMDLEAKGPFVIFPLLKTHKTEITTINKAYYDCIGKVQVSEEDGVFIKRESLGLFQLHNISQDKIRVLPETIWAHFAFRYIMNIGDSGLYNAIATETLDDIYGIDMEEHRAAVKGHDIINLMFTKLPKKAFIPEIQKALKSNKDSLYEIFKKEYDFAKLRKLYNDYGIEDESERCQRRFARFTNAVSRL